MSLQTGNTCSSFFFFPPLVCPEGAPGVPPYSLRGGAPSQGGHSSFGQERVFLADLHARGLPPYGQPRDAGGRAPRSGMSSGSCSSPSRETHAWLEEAHC